VLFKSTNNKKQNTNTMKAKIKRADNPGIMKAAHTIDTESSMDQARLGFEIRNKDIKDEMQSLMGRIELKEGEGENIYANSWKKKNNLKTYNTTGKHGKTSKTRM